jgi:RNA polymerase sigma-70 factor (ECF subfamily)
MAQLAPEMMDMPATGQATPVDTLSYKELLAAIRLLSPVYRQVFNLFVLEGMSHEEIAGELGISVGTSKSNLSKAREKMKKILTSLRSINAYV